MAGLEGSGNRVNGNGDGHLEEGELRRQGPQEVEKWSRLGEKEVVMWFCSEYLEEG